jgi:hypothetical protein
VRSVIVAAAPLVACGTTVSLEEPPPGVPNPAPACAREQPWFHEVDPELVQIDEVHWAADGRSYLIGKGQLSLPAHSLPQGEGHGFIAQLDPCGSVQWERRVATTDDGYKTTSGVVTESGGFAFVVDVAVEDFFDEPFVVQYGVLDPDGAVLMRREISRNLYPDSLRGPDAALAVAADRVAVAYACSEESEAAACPRSRAIVDVMTQGSELVWSRSIGITSDDGTSVETLQPSLAIHPNGEVTLLVYGRHAWKETGSIEVDGEPLGPGMAAWIRFARDGGIATARLFPHAVGGTIAASGDRVWLRANAHEETDFGIGETARDAFLRLGTDLSTELGYACDISYGELGALSLGGLRARPDGSAFLWGHVVDGGGGLGIGDTGADGPFVLLFDAEGAIERIEPNYVTLDIRDDGARLGAGTTGTEPFVYPGYDEVPFVGRTR